jgi:hypothetical protein
MAYPPQSMRPASRGTVRSWRAIAAAAGIACIAWGAGWAGEDDPPVEAAAKARPPDLSQTLAATRSTQKPMNLLLTQAELRAVIREHELRTGESFTDPIVDDEILVTAPGVQAPMRDPSQNIGQGLFAPFWAVRNPRDAWRIFVPVPPKGLPREDEPVRAEDRFY